VTIGAPEHRAGLWTRDPGDWRGRMGGEQYRRDIADGLRGAFERAVPLDWQLETTRVVIFSDLHRGQGDAADDFRQCRATYHRALGYYLEDGYSLVVLGDAEELWEGWPTKVIRTYQDSLKLESLFAKVSDRYLRVWGNHDDQWQFPGRVAAHLEPIYGVLKVPESVLVQLRSGDEEVGRIFLVHGHQGTAASDRYGKYSRFLVRWVWRPVQRLFKIKLNTPATDFKLRGDHDRAMYEWAAAQQGLVLVAGHTHRPVFVSQAHAEVLEHRYRELAKIPTESLTRQEREQKALARAELEWARAQDGESGEGLARDRPCYFNSGCCCFSDGDITGIEIADGEIRLVRWSTDHHDPSTRFLARQDFRSVFAKLQS